MADNYYHPLAMEERTSSRERSHSKKGTGEVAGQRGQSKITDFTDSQDKERQLETNHSDSENNDETDNSHCNQITAVLKRIENNTEENKRQHKQVSTQVDRMLSEMFELRKENDFLRKKISTLEKNSIGMADELERLERKVNRISRIR